MKHFSWIGWLAAWALGLSPVGRLGAAEVSGTLSADTTWSAEGSPYLLTGPVVVGSGVTLRVQPGATVQFTRGVDLVITNGARLLAEGTAAKPIRFSRPPGKRQRWGGIIILG